MTCLTPHGGVRRYEYVLIFLILVIGTLMLSGCLSAESSPDPIKKLDPSPIKTPLPNVSLANGPSGIEDSLKDGMETGIEKTSFDLKLVNTESESYFYDELTKKEVFDYYNKSLKDEWKLFYSSNYSSNGLKFHFMYYREKGKHLTNSSVIMITVEDGLDLLGIAKGDIEKQ